MFGTKTDVPLHEVQDIYENAARRFAEGRETPRVPVRMTLTAKSGAPVTLAVSDGARALQAVGPEPEQARSAATTQKDIYKYLQKTGGTPYTLEGAAIDLEDGLRLPGSMLNGLRRSALNALSCKRREPPQRVWREAPLAEPQPHVLPFLGYLAEVRELAQATDALLEAEPAGLYVPLTALAEDPVRAGELAAAVPVAAVLPRIYFDAEAPQIRAMLETVRAAGVRAAVAGNLGQLAPLRSLGFTVYGDFGLNATNSAALAALWQAGVTRQTLSFELRFPQIRDLAKPMETELLVYGYLPLMVFENCAIRRQGGKCACEDAPCELTDRTGKRFRLLPEYGCRNTLLNSQPLYLPDRQAYCALGVPYARLRFTIESPARCVSVLRAYQAGETLAFAEDTTRGLYFRGVT